MEEELLKRQKENQTELDKILNELKNSPY